MSDWLTADSDVFICMISWMIRPPCEITDQLAVGTQNCCCFSTLFYTPYTNIKTCAQMHQNAPLPVKKIKKISEGAQPPPQTPPPLGSGYPLPRPPLSPSAPRLSRLRRSAFPFLFIYDSNTGDVPLYCLVTCLSLLILFPRIMARP